VSGLAMLFTVAKVNVDGQGINVCNWIWKTRKSTRLTYYVHEMLDKITQWMFLPHILSLDLIETRSALSLNIITSISASNMEVFVKCGRGVCLEISTGIWIYI
jgi:hypothetical protein